MATKPPGAYSRRYQKFQQQRNRPVDQKLLGAINCVFTRSGISRLVDLGAGEGRWVRALRELNYDVQGVDGTRDIERLTGGDVQFGDLTCPMHLMWPGVLSIEVGEHIPPEYERDYLRCLAGATERVLFLTWAVPEQPGRDHVNCLPPEFVAAAVVETDPYLALDRELTRLARQKAGELWQRILVFSRV